MPATVVGEASVGAFELTGKEANPNVLMATPVMNKAINLRVSFDRHMAPGYPQ